MSAEINNEEISGPIKQENEEEKKIIENIINSKEDGKQYLEGELHKEFQENKIDSNLTEINNNNNINTEEKNISQRNLFLKDKLYNMKLNKNITNGINKTMDKQMKNIESDIFENKILMTEIPKNLNNILSKSIQNLSSYEKKNKFKALRELQEEKNNLNIKLQKIISNEKFLDNEGYMKNTGENSANNFSLVDQKVFENKKKILNEKKKKK